jgi:citrate synthase
MNDSFMNQGPAVMDQNFINKHLDEVLANTRIDQELYYNYNVKRGLRNSDGSGVLVGLTQVGSVVGYGMFEQELQPVPGKLMYRGIEIRDLVKGFQAEKRFGFEETCFLLLFGHLPTKAELEEFCNVLDSVRPLPIGFKESAILHMPSPNVMNKLARCVLANYSFDENPDDVSVGNVLRQSLELIARLPTYAVYGCQAKAHYYGGKSLHMRVPKKGLSTAEHILCLLRPYSDYTQLEAELLDLCLVIHAEHGGGNNSTFTTHVVSSTFTDTYSAIAAAILSLKGPRHGGANIQVTDMMENIKENISDWEDKAAIKDYLAKILNKEVYDKKGLIYGLGHAVYKISDPRAEVLYEKAKQLVGEHPEYEKEFHLYENVAEIGRDLFMEKTKSSRRMCINVDFYSGLVYKMLDIPSDLFTPLFAIGRMPGWCAHRLEELNSNSKIIRPAYKCVVHSKPYIPMNER